MTNQLNRKLQSELGYYRIHQILELIPICASTWWAGIKSGRFPSPVKLGTRTAYWRKSDIHILLSKISHGELT